MLGMLAMFSMPCHSNNYYLRVHRSIQNKERFPPEHVYLSTANYNATRSDKLYLR